MGNIVGNPGTTVYIRDNSGSIEQSSDLINWYIIGTGCTITNNNPSSNRYLTVKLYTDITFTSSSQYFVINSEYIIFDGDNHTVLIDNVTNFNGFIKNGSNSFSGYSNVTIKNIGIITSGTSTLSNNNSWLTHYYYSSNAINNLIDNCYSTGIISNSYTAGISAPLTANNGYCTISNCYSTGDISGNESSGICGSGAGRDNGNCVIINCYSTGNISGNQASGIAGSFAAQFGNCTITNCYSNGEISGVSSGGICGTGAGFLNGNCTISNCYSTGNISGITAGGICGFSTANNNGNCSISNCFSTGEISGNGSGGITGENTGGTSGTCTISNCYSIGNITGLSSGGICGKYSAADISSCIINSCYSIGNIIGADSGGICGEYAGGNPFSPTLGTCTVSNSYSLGSYSASNGIFGSGKQVTATETNCYSANGTWSTSNALSNLTGIPTYNSSTNVTQGTSWTDYNISSVNTPWILSSFNKRLYNPNSKKLYKKNIYNTNNTLGTSSINTIISVNNSNLYDNISINTSNGVITYTNKTKGKYKTLVFNYDLSGIVPYNYQINNFTLNVISNFKRPNSQQQALNQSLNISPIWNAYKYYQKYALELGFVRIKFKDYKTMYYK
jgi:hypothetical protein